MKSRINTSVTALITAFFVLLTVLPAVYADENTVYISTAAEFAEFSKNCTLDTWSRDKTVNLMCDIDFSGCDFLPVPTFGGVFNGNGYTVSGIKLNKKGAHYGVFRYVQQGAEILNFNVSGEFVPEGSKSYIGGIAGENSGNIEMCSFNGTVNGENVVGGIAGNNLDSGKIISCTSAGNISGENSTGGIAGKNSGFISGCTNNSLVNTVYEEKKKSISDIETDKDAIIENYRNKAEENEDESVFGHTDTGGIAGYSSGIIQGCVNKAPVGYRHIGYNVGGIAGRQSGYLLGCKNNGFIQGRKDVGGIAGQAEPYILLSASGTTLNDLKTELDNLDIMVNRFITDADNLGDDTELSFDGISDYTKDARDSAEFLANSGTDFVDENLDEINAWTAILSNTFDKLIPVFESFEDGSGDLKDAFDEISDTLDDIGIYAPDLKKETEDISSAVSRISKSVKSMKEAFSKLKLAESDLSEAVRISNMTDVTAALRGISEAVDDIVNAKREIKLSISEIEDIFASKPENFENIGINAKEIAENLKNIKNNISVVISSLEKISDSICTVAKNTEIDFKELKFVSDEIEEAAESLDDAMYYLSSGLENLSGGLGAFSDKLSDYLDDTAEQLNTAKDRLADGMDSLSYAVDDIENAISDMKAILSDLSDEDAIEFIKLGDDFKNAGENLFDSLSGISDEIEILKNTLSSGKNKITADVTALSNQFNLIMNMLIGELDEIKNENGGISERFFDASDEDIESTKQGKIEDCFNSGRVCADRNTGGIAGAMAVEYSKDPEDDIEKPDTLNFTYRSKAVLQSCVNEGEIIGKKDCAGGITGFSEIGTVYRCENYGNTESTDGGYAGGIAGKSESAIRKSYSKSRVSGKRCVGGIAGKSEVITASCSISGVSGEENIGAVCGSTENLDLLYQNFYIDKGIGAVDGISYKEKAEPVSFDDLKNISGIPERFISFSVTFTADKKTVAVRNIKYGESTSKIKYPEIPEKKGYFGKWQQPECETVTENIDLICEYSPYITVLSSCEKNEKGKLPLAVCEGEFTDAAELHITETEETLPEMNGGNFRIYSVELTNTDIEDNEPVKIRILNENRNNVTVWRLDGGKWEKLKTEDNGKYVITEVLGAKSTVCIRYGNKSFKLLLTVILLSVFVCIIVTVAAVLIKRKKRSK